MKLGDASTTYQQTWSRGTGCWLCKTRGGMGSAGYEQPSDRYQGEKEDMAALQITKAEFDGDWNYSTAPNQALLKFSFQAT